MVSDAVRRQSRRGFNDKAFCDFFKKEIGALWTITARRSIRTIPIIVRCIKTFGSVYNRYPTPDIRYCGMIRVKFYICVVRITTSWVLVVSFLYREDGNIGKVLSIGRGHVLRHLICGICA